jgi:Phosphotransferase enzyme family
MEDMMVQRFDFDPQLPALPLAFDRDAVAQLFAERWPEPSDGTPVAIRTCRLQDTKYQPATRCVTTYELLVERPGSSPRQTIGVLEITPAGPAHRLYDNDPRLPWLAAANDPAGMRERFAALLAQAPDAPAVEACAITPIRYKPGSRCVFRYDLRTAAGEQTYFGKLVAKGADQLLATIAALHQASQLAPDMPRILQPLAYWPDVQMLIQSAVAGGAELNTLAFDATVDVALRERWLRDAGVRLAALHSSAGADAPTHSFDDDMAELREYCAPMARVDAPLAARYTDLIEQIAAAAHGQNAATRVASHGAFRTDQFMIEDEQLVMIDLDGFCWADPARDLGNFLAYLCWKAIRNPQQAAFIERAGRVCLDGYQARRPAPEPGWLALYQADSLLKIAGRRYRSLTAKEWSLVPQLLDSAAQAIAPLR